MRRRPKSTDTGAVPADLASFDPRAWPAETEADSFELWRTACRTHADHHGWPGGPEALFVLLVDTRRRLAGLPPVHPSTGHMTPRT